MKRSFRLTNDEIIYAVPGHPLVAERTVQLLLEMGEERGVTIEVSGGQSFLDDIFRVLRIDPIEGFQLLDGTDLKQEEIQLRQHILVGQVYDSICRFECKTNIYGKTTIRL